MILKYRIFFFLAFIQIQVNTLSKCCTLSERERNRHMVDYLFSMRVCTLRTKSRAIVRTCGTLWCSAISEEGNQIKHTVLQEPNWLCWFTYEAAYGVVLFDVVSKHNKSSCYIQNIHSASKKKVAMKWNNWIVKYYIP